MDNAITISNAHEISKVKRLEKKSKMALLFSEQFEELGGREWVTYEYFARWLSIPLTKMGQPQISRQNINEWHRQIRLPYKDKFEMILRLSDEESDQYQFAEKVMRVLNE